MVLQGMDGSQPRMVFPRVLSLVRYCILFIHLGSPRFWQRLEPKASFTWMYALHAYIHCRPANASLVVWEMGDVLGNLEAWMSSNRLRLNPAKTKFMWLGTRQQLAKLNLDALANKFPSYTFSATARDLGVLLDQEVTFAQHLHRLSRDCCYQLRQLRNVARLLTASAATTLVHAFITSRLDYCSTLYTGLPACRLSCLESVMRSAARIFGKIQKFDHVTRYMLDVLHWLPFRQRIQYRVVSLVWRCQLGLAPAYLRDLRDLCRPVLGPRVADPFALLRGVFWWFRLPYSVYAEPRILCCGP